MGRTILAVLVGLVVAWLVIVASQFASAAAYPPPPGLDITDPVQLAAFIRGAPVVAMAAVLGGWVLGAAAGGWTAARISRRHPRIAALLVGAMVLAGVIFNATMIPHPVWMTVAGIALPLPAAWLAARWAHPHPRATPSL